MEEKEEILINTLYTGDYTNKNIGHEIINLYKTDNDKNYIYISPYGTIAKERYGKVKTIFLARPAGKRRLEIIAKATISNKNNVLPEEPSEEDINEIKKKFKDENNAHKVYAEKILEDKGMLDLNIDEIKQKLYIDKLIEDFKKDKNAGESIKYITDKFIMSRKIVTPRQIRNIQNKFILVQFGKLKYENIYVEKKVNSKAVNEVRENFLKIGGIEEDIADIAPKISDEDVSVICRKILNGIKMNEDTLTKIEGEFWNTTYGKKYLQREPIRIHQERLIKEEITYGDMPLNDIFKSQSDIDSWPVVHFTFSVDDVQRPSKPIYITYTSNDKNSKNNDNAEIEKNKDDVDSENTGGLSENEQNTCCFLSENITKSKNDDEISRTYAFRNINFRNQSCLKYITNKNNIEDDVISEIPLKELKNPGEGNIYCVLKKIISDEKLWEKDSTKRIDIVDKNSEPCFFEIIGKQNDELAYSNMFAYIFKKYPKEFEKIANEKLGCTNFSTGNKFEVLREENNIDILIHTENDIFAIENKIKSHINGEKYSDNITSDESIEYTNQLIKYHNYVESIKNGKNTHYFIFKPGYNDIETELKDKIEKTKNQDIETILKKYKCINYSELHKYFDENKKEDDKYYMDFIKALELHKDNTDRTIEMEMEHKFRKAIQEATQNNTK